MKSKVLVADDSASIQKIILMAFEKENVEIQGIENGQAAFELLDSFQPDIVLADTKMPGFDGYELSRRIKESNPNIPVILLESDFDDFDEARFKISKADDHIAKPFKSDDIVQKVKALLPKHGKHQPLRNIVQEIEMLNEQDQESSMVEGNSPIASPEELSGTLRSLFGAPVAGLPTAGVPTAGAAKGESRESWDLEPTATRPATPPDLIAETMSNLSALSRNLWPEENRPTAPAPGTAAPTPSLASDALNRVIGEQISQAVEKFMDKTLRNEISGLSNSVVETIRDMVKEMAPEIIRSVVQKEIDNIKKAENV